MLGMLVPQKDDSNMCPFKAPGPDALTMCSEYAMKT